MPDAVVPGRALERTTTISEAAQAVADHLVDAGMSMPSVYIAVAGRLRCIAQRGYWQVHDGVPPTVGVLGTTFRSGRPSIITDVTTAPQFVAAGRDVVAEVAYPLTCDGRVVGVLNVESQRHLHVSDVEQVAACATALAERIEQLGGLPGENRWQLLAREAAVFGRLQDPGVVARRAVERAAVVSDLDSAVLVTSEQGNHRIAASAGPLGPVLQRLRPETIAAIADWSGGGASAYTFGSFPGSGFRGAEQVWDAGVAALVYVPLLGSTGQEGFLLVADGRPKRPTTDDVQVLELYAAHIATALHAANAFVELRRQASRDTLTGLGHNAAFHARLDDERRQPGADGLAVLLVDLDSFKHINDTAGHLAGDRVLTEVAQALAGAVRDADLVYRIGGDEFAAVVRVSNVTEARAVAGRLREAVSATGHTTASVGIAYEAGDTAAQVTAEVLRADADLALYEAKRRGGDCEEVFRPALREAVLRRSRLAAELSGAVDRGELFCVFQPVIDLERGTVLGAETLVRWRHPDRGIVAPDDFIGVAEEDGQIGELGAWVLWQACETGARWNALAGRSVKIGVNVSGLQLEPSFPALVSEALAESGLEAGDLVLEITESALVDDASRIEVLSAVHLLGVRVAVDDFGTGYSSLSYLRRLPIDIVKIDRSFVAELGDRRNAAVARAIVDLARTLRLSSVGEGVETHEQAAQLRALGCEHAQGYWFCPPVDADEIEAFLTLGGRSLREGGVVVDSRDRAAAGGALDGRRMS